MTLIVVRVSTSAQNGQTAHCESSRSGELTRAIAQRCDRPDHTPACPVLRLGAHRRIRSSGKHLQHASRREAKTSGEQFVWITELDGLFAESSRSLRPGLADDCHECLLRSLRAKRGHPRHFRFLWRMGSARITAALSISRNSRCCTRPHPPLNFKVLAATHSSSLRDLMQDHQPAAAVPHVLADTRLRNPFALSSSCCSSTSPQYDARSRAGDVQFTCRR